VLAGGLGLAALPPGPGFASEWLLFQSLFAAPRVGGLAMQTTLAITAALMALSAALAAAATIRLIGVAFLGRPRTPRAAAAKEAGKRARAAMIGLAALTGLLGVLPGPALRLADPALQAVLGSDGIAERAGLLAVTASDGTPGYAALAVTLLIVAIGGLTYALLRRFGIGGFRTGPAWACGFAAPPPWWPFGDPLTQYGAASFSQPLRRSLGTALLAAREQVDLPEAGDPRPAAFAASVRDPVDALLLDPLRRVKEAMAMQADRVQFLTVRRTLALVFAAVVLLLVVIACLEVAG
jgi:hypothetical protein